MSQAFSFKKKFIEIKLIYNVVLISSVQQNDSEWAEWLSCVCVCVYIYIYVLWASQVALVVKNQPANTGDIREVGSILGSGRSPGGGHSNPFQYSCLENPHGQRSHVLCHIPLSGISLYRVTKSQAWLKQPGMQTYVSHDVIYVSILFHIPVHGGLFVGYSVQLSVLYRRALFMHAVNNNLHLLIPDSHSMAPPAPSPWHPPVCSLCLWVCFCLIDKFICVTFWIPHISYIVYIYI